MAWIEGLARILVVNLVPLWGFAAQDWSPGTTLALYWFQTLVGIPVTAALIVLHRNMTHKAGHYSGLTVTTDNITGRQTVKRSTFLNGFLWMSIPFVLAHGVFLAFLLGLVWRNAAGAVDYEDVRVGAVAALNVMAAGFAFEVFSLRSRSFAWVENRATTVMRRTILVHMVIIIGMGAAAFAERDSETFFAVFLGMKLLFDVLGELPQYDPREPPQWVTRIMNRIGGSDSDFAADWKKMSAEQRSNAELAEQTIESLDAPERTSPR